MENLNEYGLLFYGFSNTDAESVTDAFSCQINSNVMAISSSTMEDLVLEDVLISGGSKIFEKSDAAFIMFLGFSDEQISKCLKAFPDTISRPIFCALTRNNLHWKISYLIVHLLDEKKQMEESQN